MRWMLPRVQTQQNPCHIKMRLHRGTKQDCDLSLTVQARCWGGCVLVLEYMFLDSWLTGCPDFLSPFRGRSEAPSLQRVRSRRRGRCSSSLPSHACHFRGRRLDLRKRSPTPIHTNCPYTSQSPRSEPQWVPVREQVHLISPWCQFAFSMHCLPTFNLSDRCQPNSHHVRADVLFECKCVRVCMWVVWMMVYRTKMFFYFVLF